MVAQFKALFIDLVTYGFPTVAILISLYSFFESRKAVKVQDRINTLEEKIKKYELEKIEQERIEAAKACIEARIINISKNNYSMRIWNSGKATAYNIDFQVPDECKGMVWKENVPFEFLEAGKSFEERVLLFGGVPRKFKVTTTWLDQNDNQCSKDQIVTI